eukprot:Selendium_serpulae@DN8458_c0_g1_i1.p2
MGPTATGRSAVRVARVRPDGAARAATSSRSSSADSAKRRAHTTSGGDAARRSDFVSRPRQERHTQRSGRREGRHSDSEEDNSSSSSDASHSSTGSESEASSGVEDDERARLRSTLSLAPGGGTDLFTWDPRNPLNTIGPHAGCHGSRCDHIFLPPLDLDPTHDFEHSEDEEELAEDAFDNQDLDNEDDLSLARRGSASRPLAAPRGRRNTTDGAGLDAPDRPAGGVPTSLLRRPSGDSGVGDARAQGCSAVAGRETAAQCNAGRVRRVKETPLTPSKAEIVLRATLVAVDGGCIVCVGTRVLVTLNNKYDVRVELSRVVPRNK